MIQKTVEHFGGLDILVNNAGIHIPGNSQELSIADWDKVVGVDLRSIFVTMKIAIPHLSKSKFGRIIQIASVNAYGGGAGPAYAAAKAAVVNMTRDVALEVAQENITVNTICPGPTDTPLLRNVDPTGKLLEALKRAVPSSVPRFQVGL